MGHLQAGQRAEKRLTESRMKQKYCKGRTPCSKREKGNRSVDQKQIDCQIFLQQKNGLIQDQQRIAVRGLQSWRALCKFPQAREGECFYREERRWGGLEYKESMAFHRLNPSQERSSLSSSCSGLCYLAGHESSPLWSPAPLAVKAQSPNHWTTREFPPNSI